MGLGLANTHSKEIFYLVVSEAYSTIFAEMVILAMKVAVGKKPIGTFLSNGQKCTYDSVLES